MPTAHAQTLVDALLPRRTAMLEAGLVVFFGLVIGLSSLVAIPLPFTPVPLTLQTMTVLLAGLLLGSRLGALSVIAYIGQGLVGMPVFASGAWGLARLAGPTGGYLVGFVFAAALVGVLAERGWDRRAATTVAAMVLGNAVIYGFGVLWLASFVPPQAALLQGAVPFLAGDAMKIAAVAAALPAGWSRLAAR
ncbi:MAG: biotin transporter BioY [Myxococcales bacterium]|jgi:biotin transport system substrate-specific component